MQKAEISLGGLIRLFREDHGWDRPEMAKKLKISKKYLEHLENDIRVPLSDRVFNALTQDMGLFIPRRLQIIHNTKADEYHKKFRQNRRQSSSSP